MEWHANYTFRKSILEKAQYRELSDQGILFKPGNSGEQLISYSTISSVRLRFQHYNRYRHNNYCCTIKVGSRTFDILSTHHVDVAKFNDQAGAYTVFVQELVKKNILFLPSFGGVGGGLSQSAFCFLEQWQRTHKPTTAQPNMTKVRKQRGYKIIPKP